jgi:hypothetical protein
MSRLIVAVPGPSYMAGPLRLTVCPSQVTGTLQRIAVEAGELGDHDFFVLCSGGPA